MKKVWKDFGQIGVLGPTAPKEFGGSQLGYTAHCHFVEEITKASASVGLSYIAHSNLCVNQISKHGTKEQKAMYLPKLCSGDYIGALAISEPGSGSDAAGLQLRAKKSADGQYYTLTGNKMWITNGPLADVFVVYAKTEPEKQHKGITTFLVEKKQGIQIAQKLKKFGMRGSLTAELVFDDVKVPASNILGQYNKGVYVLMSGLDYERLCLSAGPVGIMQSAYDLLLPKQINNVCDNGAKEVIGQIYTTLQACRNALYQIALKADNSEQTRIECASLFLRVSEESVAVTNQIMSLLGNFLFKGQYGFDESSQADRLLRDAKLYEIGGGTNEIRRMLIGRELVKSVSSQKIQFNNMVESTQSNQNQEREYYADSYKFSSTAQVLQVDNSKSPQIKVLLSKTIFHPQGGGQPSDQGVLVNFQGAVFKVTTLEQNEQKQILHVGEFEDQGKTFQQGEEVQLKIDQDFRVKVAKCHSAGHLLDVAVRRINLNWKPGKGYHFLQGAYVEYLGDLPKNADKNELIEKIQQSCNDIIQNVRENDQVLISLDQNQVRFVKLLEEDEGCNCGGTHVKHIKEIGKLNVKKINKKGKNVRVSYEVA